ncbi:uncharacterized protein LOC115626479 [Scaptodrosophila lebanonensis]|uniref:Uncharacterized protein LOC115626479 n=1 Tax=Drosophila lebanonensis TaxID=7225 RepID=A0A6J2TMD3_DROLE|nr:uncharacterized protein LOC115626479 [Scaptodrosophila lebanonensis]
MPMIKADGDQKFFVKTRTCRMPYVDPLNADAMKIYKPIEFIPCTNQSDLVSVLYDNSLQRYVLRINTEVAHQLLNSNRIGYKCYYNKICYGNQTETYDTLGPVRRLRQNFVVPLHIEGLLLKCVVPGKPSWVLQRDAYMFIQYRRQLNAAKKNKKKKHKPEQPRKASVIMYGIDTVSRINLRRTMPMVYKFLQRRGWYEMQGYNKVEDNSFPNILALLTGYLPNSAKKHLCDTDFRGCLDKLPFIWNDFKKAGYLTAYAEDISVSNTFSYTKPGFTKKPTDYYFRPFLKALERYTRRYKCPSCYMTYCMGRRLVNSYIFDYCRQFMQRYVAERPIWGMFWSNHIAHDDFTMPASMELKILQDLLNFSADGAFEHTIMIFFSDHGARFGPLQSLPESYLDERLPMMFIYLPPWFRRRYPQYAQALSSNQHRLSSTFDLHNTLKHIIQLGSNSPEPRAQSFDCPTCQSLFYPVMENRTCPDAGISEHYCTCDPYREIKEDWGKRIAPRVLDIINKYLVDQGKAHKCVHLTIHEIMKTEIKMDIDSLDQVPQLETAVYRTRFTTQQNLAEFHATVVFNNITEQVQVDVETISRTKVYGYDSKCIKETDRIVKFFCICPNSLKKIPVNT